MELKVWRGPEISTTLIDTIVALDRQNIGPFLASVGASFPETRRRAGLGGATTTLVLAQVAEEISGYADFCRSWADAQDIYLGSLQVLPKWRGSRVTAALLRECARLLRAEDFRYLVSDVHRENDGARRLYRRLGFEETDRGTGLLGLRASRAAFDDALPS